MFLKPHLYGLLCALVTCATFNGFMADAQNHEAIPVEIWRGGDDGATIKLTDAVEAAFVASQRFVLSHGNKLGTLFVYIPTSVHWQQIAGREEISYTVEFMKKSPLRTAKLSGSCWLDQLAICTDEIVKKAMTLSTPESE